MKFDFCPCCLAATDFRTTQNRKAIFDEFHRLNGGPLDLDLLSETLGKSIQFMRGCVRQLVMSEYASRYKDGYYLSLKGIEFMKSIGYDVTAIVNRVKHVK